MKKKSVAGGGGLDGGPLHITEIKNVKINMKKLKEFPKTKLQPDHFGVFHYGHHFSITIGKNYSNPTTCRQDINKICMALFGKPRYTEEQIEALKDNGSL